MNWKRMLKAAAVGHVISTGREALKPRPDSAADWLCLRHLLNLRTRTLNSKMRNSNSIGFRRFTGANEKHPNFPQFY